jgi:hypothetical protein
VKDVLDTADMPSGYGSPIWQGWRPRADAACVAWARAAGAVVVGKTVTTELGIAGVGPGQSGSEPAVTGCSEKVGSTRSAANLRAGIYKALAHGKTPAESRLSTYRMKLLSQNRDARPLCGVDT